MPKPRKNEKPKNFLGSIKRLFKSLGKWKILIIISLVLASLSAILSLLAPNKLSSFTDEIQNGLIPKTEKIKEISEKISNSFNEDNISKNILKVNKSSDVSDESKEEFNNTLIKIKTTDDKEKMISLFMSLPDDVLNVFLTDFKVDNTVITKKDQISFIKVFSNIDSSDNSKMLNELDKLPSSIKNIIKPTIDMKKIKYLAILIGAIYLIGALFSYIEGFIMTTISNGYAKLLRTNITNKINKLPLKYFDNHEIGDILSRITNDVDSISQNLNNSLASLISNFTLFVGSIIMMFITNYVMAITAILSTIVGFVFMGLILGKSQKFFEESQRSLGELNGYIEEIYSGHNVVKAYNGSKLAIEEFENLNNNLYKAKRNSIFLSGLMQPIMGFVGNLGYVCVCVVGALLVIKGNISFGVIVAFMIYIRLFTNPLNQIAQAMTNMQTTAAAAERVFEFMDEEEMRCEKVDTYLHRHKVKGKIEFKHVKFGYNENKLIIKDFSCNVKPGEKIAIVGPTGAGKTTLVNLLMKFYEINDGDILIDDVSIKDISRENVHKLFVMVLQDTWLFNGTIKENIKYNSLNITDNEIKDVCNIVGVDHFIKTLPGNYDASVNDSDSISSGQKQLLTIARGMIEDAPFLILDEATSNVDTRTEELVAKAMDKLTKGRTSFIIAHRLSTIKNADLILVMKDGNIIEQGNHKELMKKNGFYAELYNSQFKN